MTRFLALFALVTCLSGCLDGTNPFDEETTEATTTTDDTTTTEEEAEEETVETDTGTPIDSDRTLLPGTVNPTATNSLFRTEATSTADATNGNGYAEGFRYDSATDTFAVDNIAFDGDSPYIRTTVADPVTGDPVNLGIGPFNVFQAEATATDILNGAQINQLGYRALYAVGPSGDTEIAIVRTNAYIPYGFGGYTFQRNGSVELPQEGQAHYTGTNNYGGLRDFVGEGTLEYVRGDIEVSIDFDDFNSGDGVKGYVTNREYFALDGTTNLTPDILTALGATEIPTLIFTIGPSVLDSNGELVGELLSRDPGSSDTLESGNYYAVLSGENANTITGVVVVTSTDPRGDNLTVRETAGFFAQR